MLAHLRAEKIAIVAGPVTRRGAVGQMRSLYFRDPDGNLIEVSEYENG
jgi:catechol 2,3-dioxygenase-like lactoylglutathione lyase family enzyme